MGLWKRGRVDRGTSPPQTHMPMVSFCRVFSDILPPGTRLAKPVEENLLACSVPMSLRGASCTTTRGPAEAGRAVAGLPPFKKRPPGPWGERKGGEHEGMGILRGEPRPAEAGRPLL
jgi:hypothetical protein